MQPPRPPWFRGLGRARLPRSAGRDVPAHTRPCQRVQRLLPSRAGRWRTPSRNEHTPPRHLHAAGAGRCSGGFRRPGRRGRGSIGVLRGLAGLGPWGCGVGPAQRVPTAAHSADRAPSPIASQARAGAKAHRPIRRHAAAPDPFPRARIPLHRVGVLRGKCTAMTPPVAPSRRVHAAYRQQLHPYADTMEPAAGPKPPLAPKPERSGGGSAEAVDPAAEMRFAEKAPPSFSSGVAHEGSNTETAHDTSRRAAQTHPKSTPEQERIMHDVARLPRAPPRFAELGSCTLRGTAHLSR